MRVPLGRLDRQLTTRHFMSARGVSGMLCAAAVTGFSVVNVEWPQVVAAFRGASLSGTVAASASVLFTLSLVTFRWGLLADGPGGELQLRVSTRWRVLWDSVVLGQAVNILVPLRFGEGARLVVATRNRPDFEKAGVKIVDPFAAG